MRIRNATPEDAAVLADLCGQLGHPADAAGTARRLGEITRQRAGAVLVAVDAEGRVVGFAQLLPQPFLVEDAFVELIALVVDARSRGRGAGAALLHAVEAWAREHGFGGMYVRSNVIRERAHRFYRRAGYVEKKRQAVFFKQLADGART